VCLETIAVKQACFSIHVENRYASGKTKRPRGPRSSLTLSRPHIDLQTQALTYYLQHHLQVLTDVPNNLIGLSDCISAWKLSGKNCPMVDLALSSMALAVFSRTQQRPQAATEASSIYHRLLRVAQERIAQLATSAVDDKGIDCFLLAVSLMGRYEGVTNPPEEFRSKGCLKSLQTWSHHDGAMAILKVWYDNLSHNSASCIMKQTRREFLRSSLLRNISLPDWMLDGSPFGEHDLQLDYDRIVVRLVNLRYASTSLEQRDGLNTMQTVQLSTEAQELDRLLQDWATKIPSDCSYRRHILTEPDQPDLLPKRHFHSSTVYSFPTPGNAAAWSQLFALRMLVNSTRLQVLEPSHPDSFAISNYDTQRLECIDQLNATAESLASSIPFALERFNVDKSSSPINQTSISINTDNRIKPYLASMVMWPLTIASSIEEIDARQQVWFRSELTSLGRITGDGILESTEADEWAILCGRRD